MRIKELWHENKDCSIFIYFEGSGDPKEDHVIKGVEYVDHSGKMASFSKTAGETLYDKIDNHRAT